MGPLLLAGARLLLIVQPARATMVTGTVRDAESGRPLAGVVVTLPDARRATASDSAGRWVLRDAMAGPQHLVFESLGYGRRTLHLLVPGTGRLEIDVALQPEPIRLDGIAVRPVLRVRDVEGPDGRAPPDRRLPGAALRNHPLLAEPDAFHALAGADVVVRPETAGGVHVRGGASDQTAFLLDGIPILNPYHAAFLFSAWNPDALDGVRLHSTMRPIGAPDALSGLVEGTTREPGPRLAMRAGTSTAQARLTVDGPVGDEGVGFLVALRAGFPGTVLPRGEDSYVRGEAGDGLAKLSGPMLGGRFQVLGWQSEDELSLAAGAHRSAPRNAFEWTGRSAGVTWTGGTGTTALEFRVWSAATEATADWAPAGPDGVRLDSRRHDTGLSITAGLGPELARTSVGLRLEHMQTAYRTGGPARPGWESRTGLPVVTLSGTLRRRLAPALDVDGGLNLAVAAGRLRAAPHVRLAWSPADRLRITGGWVRTHQYAQSLRNAESIAGVLFPADLFVSAGDPRVPVGRADQAMLAAEWRPDAGARLAVEAWTRALRGLVLPAPLTTGPFADAGFLTGAGTARGLAVDASVSGARLGVVASHGWQHVRVRAGEAYVPGHATAHRTDLGVILHAAPTASVRIGLTAEMGRRGTGVLGALEWEACNLLDQGCEFSGTPEADADGLGAVRLPAYARLDVGARKHWHLTVAGRDAEIALYATITNVFGRENVLGRRTDPLTGEVAAVGLRPTAPLVAGLDWRF